MKFHPPRLFVLMAACAVLLTVAPLPAQLIISEIHTAGYEGEDPVLAGTDWIEIHNAGAAPVNLLGYRLTDKAALDPAWSFPNVTVAAGGYIVVLANGADAFDPVSGLYQTSFSLDNDGEFLALLDPPGAVVSALDPGFPSQIYGYTFGLPAGGNIYAFLANPTPGAPNPATGLAGRLDPPAFSHPRGYHDAPILVSLSAVDPVAEIRYTLDGSVPSAQDGVPYAGPITLSGTTVLRAVAVRDGWLPSEPVTRSYLFRQEALAQPAQPDGFPMVWGTEQLADYAMSPLITESPRFSRDIANRFLHVPTVSIVGDAGEIFGPSGIWGNAEERGGAWERPVSMEFIDLAPAPGFQVNAGMRMSGGAARGIENPKHPFRVYFRNRYGPGKLDYPLFGGQTFMGDSAADSFDVVLLRAVNNYSWIQSSTWFNSQALYFRDLWVADAQLAMGHPSTHGRPVHVFINGLYWGVYILQEQVDATFASDYWGGPKDDWDVVKHFLVDGMPNQDTYEVKDGSGAAWDAAQQLAQLDMSVDANFAQLARLIDVDNHIDYMLLNIYAANADGVVIRETEGNNWYGARLRLDGEGFKFINWDAEFSLVNAAEDKSDMHGTNNPATYYAAFRANKEWLGRFGDRVHLHLFNGGALSMEQNLERFLYRKAQFESPIFLEAARWGDFSGIQRTPVDWNNTVNKVLNQFFPGRGGFVLDLFRDDGLYPLIDAPVFSQHGGPVDWGYPLALQDLNAIPGTVYYTLDGSDPRLPGGAVSGQALPYSAAVRVTNPAIVSARVLKDGEWSALTRAAFVLDQDYNDLKVTELHYHPADFNGMDGDEFEFIELINRGSRTLNMQGIRFTDGIEFSFPDGFELMPLQVVVLVSNASAFAMRYPGVAIGGVYIGRLRNSGERVALSLADGTEVLALDFSDDPPWPVLADGSGYSLEAVSLYPAESPSAPAYWQLGKQAGGTPGTHAPGADTVIAWFDMVQDLGSGWFFLDWFGLFNAASFPWIHHHNQGWLYAAGKDQDVLWLYDPALGWIARSPEFGAWSYVASDGSWAR